MLCWVITLFIVSAAVAEDDAAGDTGAATAIALGWTLRVNETWPPDPARSAFILGFYSDRNEYSLGIWFRTVTPRTVVWTAGQQVRCGARGVLHLTREGDLVLMDPDAVTTTIWSSGTGNRGVSGAVLRNTGDLVLFDSARRPLWRSFLTPSDTLVPGQSLRPGNVLRATSTGAETASYYNLLMDASGNMALRWESNVTYWNSGTGSVGARSAVFTRNGVLRMLDARGRTVWARYSKDFTDKATAARRLRLDLDGNLRMYSWTRERGWEAVWQAVANQCDVFATCGGFGVCGFDSSGPVCRCPFSYSDAGAVAAGPMGGSACRAPVSLSSSTCAEGTTMEHMRSTVLYSVYPPQDLLLNASTEQCRRMCLDSPQCVAATVMNDGSGSCRLKHSRYVSGYSYPTVQAVSFFKSCLLPKAVPGSRVTGNGNATGTTDAGSACTVCIAEVGAVTAGVFLFLEAAVVAFAWKRTRTRTRRGNAARRCKAMRDGVRADSGALQRFCYAEVQDITADFQNALRPRLFRGVLNDGRAVVVKQIEEAKAGASEKQFRMAVALLASLHHRNLARLLGFCSEPDPPAHRFLVYEHVPNGSLADRLAELPWPRRASVVTGVARGLAYLHAECRECICHGNLCAENVLLDESLNPKLTDFGLARLRGAPAPTTPESDVWCFGAVLLRTVMSAVMPAEAATADDAAVAAWAYARCEGDVSAALDRAEEEATNHYQQKQKQEQEQEQELRFVRIGLWCMHAQACMRPSMAEVVKVLDGTLHVDSPPAPAPAPAETVNR